MLVGISAVVAADWSVSAHKRVAFTAVRCDQRPGAWKVTAAQPIPDVAAWADTLERLAPQAATLVAVDAPLGLPAGCGLALGVMTFRAALDVATEAFTAVSDSPTAQQPFYPLRGRASPRQAHQAASLGVSVCQLRRRCDLATPHRGPASPPLWCLGAQQVGRAAAHLWRELAIPRRHRWRLWPFDGTLNELALPGAVVLAECYPAEACVQLGVQIGARHRRSKARPSDRAAVASVLADHARQLRLEMDEPLSRELASGFSSDDAFDAWCALLLAMRVVTGHTPEHAPPAGERQMEGWILGLPATPRV